MFDDFGFAFDRVRHRDDHALGAGDEVHRAAHSRHDLAGHHPVREPPHLIDLQAAENRQIEMAAADQAEGHRAVERRRARQRADRAPAGVREILDLQSLLRQREHADDAVLGLEKDVDVALAR